MKTAETADYSEGAVGICDPDTESTHQAMVTFKQRYQRCEQPNGSSCKNLVFGEVSTTRCVDVSEVGAVTRLQPTIELPPDTDFTQIWNASVEVESITRNAALCGLSPIGNRRQSTATFASLGTIGGVFGSKRSIDLVASKLTARLNRSCDEVHCEADMQSLSINLNDISVPGASFTGVQVRNASPIHMPVAGEIPPGEMELLVTGEVNGVPSAIGVRNKTAWIAETTPNGDQLHLAGEIVLPGTDPEGKPALVTATIDTTIPKATPQEESCATYSAVQRIFGFEDRSMWTTDKGRLSQVVSDVKEGCGALGVSGQDYMTIMGQPFSTKGLDVQSALSVDLFIPGNQPNQYYLGALQMFLTCPSANVYNKYLGQTLLTGLPQERFSTLRYLLPADALTTLKGPRADCSISFGLNVNQTNRTWVLDNLRFTP